MRGRRGEGRGGEGRGRGGGGEGRGGEGRGGEGRGRGGGRGGGEERGRGGEGRGRGRGGGRKGKRGGGRYGQLVTNAEKKHTAIHLPQPTLIVEMLIWRVRITTKMMTPPRVTLDSLRSVYQGTLGIVCRMKE